MSTERTADEILDSIEAKIDTVMSMILKLPISADHKNDLYNTAVDFVDSVHDKVEQEDYHDAH